MALVELDSFAAPALAEIARLRLAHEGIESVLFDAGIAGLGLGLLSPARLMVDQADEARARRILGQPA